jgi:hypothetical protein
MAMGKARLRMYGFGSRIPAEANAQAEEKSDGSE